MPDPAPRQPSLPPIEPGTVLAGKYRVERKLGRGGMGMVVEARHLQLDELFALKFLLPDFVADQAVVARFLREARAAVKIKSEHIARVADYGTLETGAPFIVMELLVGQDLAGILQERGALALEDAVDYVIQACEALVEAHTYGIIHRDLKPANLFLTARPDGSPLVKVLDFGISKFVHAVDNVTGTAAVIGSGSYMSPEQLKDSRLVDVRTDVYSLGISLFELCTTKTPFVAETLPQLCIQILTADPTPLRTFRPDLPEAFGATLERAYRREPNERYTSIPDLVRALAPFAPPRSQPIIERIGRMGGLPSQAAAWPRDPMPSPVLGAGAVMTPIPLPAADAGAVTTPMSALPTGSAAAAVSFPQPPVLHVPSPPPAALMAPLQRPDAVVAQIIPGPYAGPVSSRAAASFASATGTSLPHPARSWMTSPIAIAILFVGALAVGVAVGLIVLRRDSVEPGAGSAGSAITLTPAPVPAPDPAAAPDPATSPASQPPPASAAALDPTAAPAVLPASDTVAPPSTSPIAPTSAPRGSGARAPQTQRPAPAPAPSKGLDLNNPN